MRTRSRSIPALAILASLLATTAVPAAQVAPPSRNVWAVVIGVEHYENRNIPPAVGARKDASDVARWLETSLKPLWPIGGLFLADEFGRETPGNLANADVRVKPTHENLTTTLREWIDLNIKPRQRPDRPDDSRDVVLIYFAGHAVGVPPVRGTDEVERDYLLPSDAQPENWGRRGLSLDWLLQPNASNPLRDCIVLCWLDTSLRGRGQTPAIWPERATPDTQLFLTRLVGWPGRSAWIAASDRPSGLDEDGKGGRFTRELLKALGAPGKGPDEEGGLMGALARLRGNRDLGAQGFQAMGAIPRGLALREADLKPLPRPPDQLVLQRGHSMEVNHFALSADEQTLITGSKDSSIRLWKPKSREVFRTFADHKDGVRALALDPGGRFLIAGDGSGKVHGYDVQTLNALSIAYPNVQPGGGQISLNPKGIEEIVRLPGGRPRFVSRDGLLPGVAGGKPMGGQILVWELAKDEKGLEGRLFVPDPANVDRRYYRLAAIDNPRALACLITVDDAGFLRAYDPDLKPLGTALSLGRTIDIAAIALNREGTRAIVLGDHGKFRAIDLATGKDAAVADLGLRQILNKGLLPGPDGLAIVLDTRGRAEIVPIDRPEAHKRFPAPVSRAAWSEDGRWLATAGTTGLPRLWRIGPDGEPTEAALDPTDRAPPLKAVSLALQRGQLLAGDEGGGVWIWGLPIDAPNAQAAFRQELAPARGRVQRVRVDRDGNRLVALTGGDRVCWTWDLRANESPRSLVGRVEAVEILPDGKGLAVCREAGDLKGGRVELIDWQGRDLGIVLDLPLGSNLLAFEDVSVSPDGRWIAGIVQGAPKVVIWELGKAPEPDRPGHLAPAAVIDDHKDLIACATFSADSKRLLTADRAGTAQIRNLADLLAPVPPGAAFRMPNGRDNLPTSLTVAAFDPDDSGRFVAGTVAGDVYFCQEAARLQDQRIRRIGSGRTARRTTGLSFARGPGGERWLGASFDDIVLQLWKIRQGNGFEAEAIPPREWRHEERVNSLVAWPSAEVPMLVSGSDDGAIRFLGLAAAGKPEKRLIGTLAVWPSDSTPIDDASMPRDWIAYTPDGAFDGTPGGVQFLRRVGNRIDTVDQQDVAHARIPNLVERFTLGESPAPAVPAPRKPPTLSVAELSRPNGRTADLRIGFDPEITDLRLYQNGVPIPLSDAQLRVINEPDASGQMSVRVHLRQGVNRFYAMASPRQPDTLEGRSDPIELRSMIPDEVPQLHLLALGVGDYQRRKLRFAAKDARDLADHVRGLIDADGRQQVGDIAFLLDKDVNARNIEGWFTRVREKVQKRPQDKVVVFLAGHTEVLQGTEEFALLPASYPFPSDWPEVAELRGPADAPVPEGLKPSVLKFGTILNQLVHLNALDRLVIIDACQAEAIFNDVAVKRIRWLVEREAQPSRTAYLLATGRDESAVEDRELEHGLMTYILLRGTGADVPAAPRADSVIAAGETADLNGDRQITTGELQTFVDRKLPSLLKLYGGDRRRGPDDRPSKQAASSIRPALDDFTLFRTAKTAAP